MIDKNLIPILEYKEKVFVDLRYEWFSSKYSEQVAHMFDNNLNQTDYDAYTWEGQKLRRELHSLAFCWEDFEKIAQDYDCHITNAQVYRLFATDKISDRDKGYTEVFSEMKLKNMWLSETWHTDNTHDFDFRLFIYLNDVGIDQGPFGYWNPVVFVPHKLNACETSGKPSGLRGPRFFQHGDTLKPINKSGSEKMLTGQAGTTILFNNNIIHKGNYCKKGYRDAICLQLLPKKHGHLMDLYGGRERTRMQKIKSRF